MRGFAKVVVVDDDAGLTGSALQAGLNDMGLASVATSLEAASDVMQSVRRPDAVMIRLPDGRGTVGYGPFMALAAHLKSQDETRNIPVILVGEELSFQACAAARPVVDDVLPLMALRERLSNRLRSALRLKVLREEFVRRQDTLADFGIIVTREGQQQIEAPLRVLLSGPEGTLSRMIQGLTALGHEVRHAPLEELDTVAEQFEPDAFVVDPMVWPELAGAKIRWIQRDGRFNSAPIAVVDRGQSILVSLGPGNLPQGIDLVPATVDPLILSYFVAAPGLEHRLRHFVAANLRSVTSPGVVDPLSGVFTGAFFGRHLVRLVDDMSQTGCALTLCLVELPVLDMAVAPRAIAACGHLIPRVLRAEDVVAYLGDGVFACAFVATSAQDAARALRRLEVCFDAQTEGGLAVLASGAPPRVSLVEREGHETALGLMARARAELV
jgi:hypothetical protein